jgi:hypothetical protein
MDVPTCSAVPEVFCISFVFEVCKVTHLMWVNPRLALSENQLTVTTTVLRNSFDGMQVANSKVRTAAVDAIKRMKPAEIVVAAPVASEDASTTTIY